MKITKLVVITTAILIAGGLIYSLLSLLGLTSIRHESDIIKRDQVPLYVTKADAGDYGAASDLYLYYKNSGQPEYALHWLRIAANGGGESPNEWLLDALKKSPNKQQQEEATALLRKLADDGRAPFQVRLGEEILRSVHANSDAKLAKNYFLSAAMQGYKPAIVKYTENLAGHIETIDDGLNAMAWIRVAKLCVGDIHLEKLDSIEKSIMESDIYASLNEKNDEINKISDATYSSIKNNTNNNKELGFRYCGIER
ncbi:sel1 repeat family protein [Ralstonia solanacearum]|uniref:sel1 repeat family protein n=1 Tax=Ralstonia solanacearum TaxID=305 RepID=UPI0018D0AE77|nr:sel1 repeat family protein [Ralstonia solanacearum]